MRSDAQPDLIVILGPTATGKTAAAVELAERLRGEVVNADSMQVYHGMDIGTAKPTIDERRRIPFHLLDIARPDEPLSVAAWKELAEAAIDEIRFRRHTPIICGGTGLYIRALLEDWTLAATPSDPEIRTKLEQKVRLIGVTALHSELDAVDPVAAARLHPNDVVRVVRALEVYYATGTPISQHQAQDRQNRNPRPARQFGLTVPREVLRERIDGRTARMIASGLKQEVEQLLAEGYSPNLGSLRSLGYKEMVQHIHKEIDLGDAVYAIKQNTSRYAKRQQTWFRTDKTIDWIDTSAIDSATVASQIIDRLERSAHPADHG